MLGGGGGVGAKAGASAAGSAEGASHCAEGAANSAEGAADSTDRAAAGTEAASSSSSGTLFFSFLREIQPNISMDLAYTQYIRRLHEGSNSKEENLSVCRGGPD